MTEHLIEEMSKLSPEDFERLPMDMLQSLSDTILEALEEKKWDELLNSPKARAYASKRREELKNEECIAYIPGVSLEELFQ